MAAPLNRSKLIRRWVFGLLGSWTCVWFVGPWVVNSVLIRVADPALNAITLREGDLIRWRSEGWATTVVGPHGMPGWKPKGSLDRVVLWGDSQVEGFCTNDEQKIHQQLIRLASQDSTEIDCLPMGRSGTDAVDWRDLIAAVDDLWQPRMHVFVVAELSDLLELDPQLISSQEGDRWRAESREALHWAKRLRGEAIVQAARNIMLDSATGRLRTLRWSPGPHVDAVPSVTRVPRIDGATPINNDDGEANDESLYHRVADALRELHSKFEGRLCIVYAPAVPRFAGTVVTEHPDDVPWEALKRQLDQRSILTIDCRPLFIDVWNRDHQVARGFHQGQMSYGHLNELGNFLIATAILKELQATNALSLSTPGAAK